MPRLLGKGRFVGTSFAQVVESYLRTPTPDTLRAVHREISASGNYDPELPLERIAAPYLQRRRYDDLLPRLLDLMPGAMLSPGTHHLLAECYERLGQLGAAGRERTLARMSVRAILAGGDGSAGRPWSVLRVSDQADALDRLGRTSRHVRYAERGDRLLDLHHCDDGSEAWFDVTLLHSAVGAVTAGAHPTR